MESSQEIVDAVVGIPVNNNLAFSYGGDDFPKGQIELDGESALNYSRMDMKILTEISVDRKGSATSSKE